MIRRRFGRRCRRCAGRGWVARCCGIDSNAEFCGVCSVRLDCPACTITIDDGRPPILDAPIDRLRKAGW